jgi:hypothetical protein
VDVHLGNGATDQSRRQTADAVLRDDVLRPAQHHDDALDASFVTVAGFGCRTVAPVEDLGE